jgi:hypothetical protein
MHEILELLERRARWQRSRKDLPWAEKIRMIERVRDDFAKWRVSVRKRAVPPHDCGDDRT